MNKQERAFLRRHKYSRIARALRILDGLSGKGVLTEAEQVDARRASSSLCRILQWKPEFRRLVTQRDGQYHREFNTHLTPTEVARHLLVTPVTVRGWATRGLLKSVRTPGGHRRFLLRDVKRFERTRPRDN